MLYLTRLKLIKQNRNKNIISDLRTSYPSTESLRTMKVEALRKVVSNLGFTPFDKKKSELIATIAAYCSMCIF